MRIHVCICQVNIRGALHCDWTYLGLAIKWGIHLNKEKYLHMTIILLEVNVI